MQDDSEEEPAPPPTTTVMLSGAEAYEWLKDEGNGYLDVDGSPTDKYRDFEALLPTEKDPDLQGIAVYRDENDNPIFTDGKGNPVEGLTIVIAVDRPLQASPVSAPEQKGEPTQILEPEEELEESEEPVEPIKTEPQISEDLQQNKGKEELLTQPEKQTPVQIGDETTVEKAKEEPPLEFPNAREDLEKMMDDIIDDKIKEHYYVINPSLPEKSWNQCVEFLGGYEGYTGGKCGEYAEWGQEWSREKIGQLFGEGAYTIDIICNQRYGGEFPFTGLTVNHGATKVISPTGERYVIDFWEGMDTEKPAVYKEKEWLTKWKKEFADKNEMNRMMQESGYERSEHAWREVEVIRSQEEKYLKNYITQFKKFGEQRAKEIYLENAADKNIAQTVIKSWEREPW